MLHLLLLLPSLVLIVDSGDGGRVSVSAVAGRSSLFLLPTPSRSCGVKAAVTPDSLLLFAKDKMAGSLLFNAFFALAPCIKSAQC